MKQMISMILASVMLAGTATAQSANGRIHGRGPNKIKSHTAHSVTDKKTKRDINRGGHMNNGDNGDKHNDRGKGDKNNH